MSAEALDWGAGLTMGWRIQAAEAVYFRTNDEFRGLELWPASWRGGFPRPTPAPAGDKPLASRSLRPHYIPLSSPPGFRPSPEGRTG